ncbi:hypothetical protein BUALT_Bualt11G0127600 [Buddleja alternifolia]|uniref:Uncharacterized protein n=1 Tax=Buddleja alternifolia TaxID=168488 RepID=A0AAV6X136_9LAMI|nr:hypothetical protein BUALT_Bualt11G0127600 [Buddleja alternifolia]
MVNADIFNRCMENELYSCCCYFEHLGGNCKGLTNILSLPGSHFDGQFPNASTVQHIVQREKILFYTALALIAVGISGHRVSLVSFRNEQLSNTNDSKPKLSELVFPFIVSTIGGICTYKKSGPQGKSPLTTMCRVFAASASNISQPLPLDGERFYKKDNFEFLSRTRYLRCLDKAAIIIPDISLEEEEKNRWRLCTIQEVEETKSFLRVVPVWMTFLVCGIVASFANTYFQEQANHMDNRVGKLHVPPIMFLMLQKWMETISEAMYIKGFRQTRQERKKLGLGVAMISSVLCCITAARVEMRRLSVIRRNGLVNKPDDDIPMSIFWLLFQLLLLAMTNSFIRQVTYDFSQYDTSEPFSDYSKYFAEGMNGVGFMCGPILVERVGKVSEKGGKTNWFQHTLNGSRLDKYYWVMAVLCSVNLLVCIFVVFTYNTRPVPADREESSTPEESIS